jgi:hypothetical protein
MMMEELEADGHGAEKEETIKWGTANLFAGGADTVRESIVCLS